MSKYDFLGRILKQFGRNPAKNTGRGRAFHFYSAAGILPFITIYSIRWPALRGNRFNPLRTMHTFIIVIKVGIALTPVLQ
jgi:hypothetical protein